MAVLLVSPFMYFTDDNGQPLAGGKVYTYLAGTTTPKATYTDQSGDIKNTNPIILDASGRAAIWGTGSYKIKVTDANGVPIGPNGGVTDNVQSFTTLSGAASTFFQQFSGDGSNKTFTLSQDMGTDPNVLDIFIDRSLRQFLVNRTFTSSASWTLGAAWTISGGVANATTSSAAISQTAAITLLPGQMYIVSYTITRSAGTLTCSIGGTNGTAQSASGTYTETIICGSTQTIAWTGSGFTGTLSNVSVTKVQSNGNEYVPPTKYTLNGNQLVFTGDAPENGVNNINVKSANTAGPAAAAAADAEASAAAAANSAAATAADRVATDADAAATAADRIQTAADVVSTGSNAATASAAATTASAASASAVSAVVAVANAWNFDSSTTIADPTTGKFRVDNASLASVTVLAISALTGDAGNPNVRGFLQTWDDSNHTPRGTIRIEKDATNFVILGVNGALTDNTTWMQIPVTVIASNGSFSNSDKIFISYSMNGNDGTGTLNASGTPANGQFTRWASATTLLGESAATHRTALGLGTAATLNAGTAASNLVQLDGSAKLPAVDGSQLTNINVGWSSLGDTATTSGTSKTVTGIPSTATEFMVFMNPVSTSGTSPFLFQVGTSGGVVSTGYSGSQSVFSSAAVGTKAQTSGVGGPYGSGMAAAISYVARIHGSKVTGNTWMITLQMGSNSTITAIGTAVVTLSGALDRINLTTEGGTDTFDNGSFTTYYK